MTPRRALTFAAIVALTLVLAWALFIAIPRRYGRRPLPASTPAVAPTMAPGPDGRKIKARLFYVSEDGTKLAGIERDVPFNEDAAEQARAIVAAQVAPVADPLLSAVPPGTTLRGLFLTPNGEAYVDLSGQVASAHTGGTLDELLTVYTIVNALTVNLPAVTTVQLLVDGKEVQTLSGHVDLRRPLTKNLSWVLQ